MRMSHVEQVSELKKDYGWIERKSEHNLYLTCEDSPQLFSLHFLSFSSCPLGFFCTLTSFTFSFSVLPTFSCIQHSTPQNTYVAENQPRCPPRPPRPPLSSFPRPCSLVHEFLSVHVSTNECKQIDIPERDRHVRTYVSTYSAGVFFFFQTNKISCRKRDWHVQESDGGWCGQKV